MSESEMKIDLTKLKRYPLRMRKNKVKKEDFAKISSKGGSFAQFYDSLPSILAAKDFKTIVDRIVTAHQDGKDVIFMLGAHVIKCGLNPILIDLIKKHIITTLALNGAGVIHDFEIALMGETSEDVAESIQDGSFGMAEETADYINDAVMSGVKKGLGIGESVGSMIAEKKMPFKELSLLYNAWHAKVPTTVHVSIGADIIHQHPSFDGASFGKASHRDFLKFIGEVARLCEGAVVLNVGSNVVLPEVFLKAVSCARNLGHSVTGFTACVLDQIRHYRPMQNILIRPISGKGEAYYIVGHHEIILPLLARAIIERL